MEGCDEEWGKRAHEKGLVLKRIVEPQTPWALLNKGSGENDYELAEAGYPNGFDAGDLTPNPPFFARGEMVANYLVAVGIKVKLRTMERAAFAAARNAKQLRGLCLCGSGRYGNAATRIEESVVST